jgi:hypothetical protein
MATLPRLLLLLAGLALSACGPRGYVVLRDVPMSPSFVVIPAGAEEDHVAFANRVESVLIESGVRVLSTPGLRHVETERAQGLGASGERLGPNESDGRSLDMEARRREEFLTYADTAADYLLVLYDDPVRIKLTRKETGEILASVPWRGDKPLERELRELLAAAGILTAADAQTT